MTGEVDITGEPDVDHPASEGLLVLEGLHDERSRTFGRREEQLDVVPRGYAWLGPELWRVDPAKTTVDHDGHAKAQIDTKAIGVAVVDFLGNRLVEICGFHQSSSSASSSSSRSWLSIRSKWTILSMICLMKNGSPM